MFLLVVTPVNLRLLISWCNRKEKLSYHSCNETESEEVKVQQLEAIMEMVTTLDQEYTLNKFEDEKKEQCRLQLEAELPKLKPYYKEIINTIYDEMKQLSVDANTLKSLNEMEHTAHSLLEDVDQKDSPELIFYAEGECRLLESIRNSLKQLMMMIVEKKDTIIKEQRKKEICSILNVCNQNILETNPHDPNIYIAIAMFKEELKSLQTEFPFDMEGKLKKKMKISMNKCKESLNELISKVQKEKEIEISQKKDQISSQIKSIDVENKAIVPILSVCKDQIGELETKINEDPSKYGFEFRSSIFRSLTKMKEKIDSKVETVRQMTGAEDLKTELKSIHETIKKFDVNVFNSKSLLADIRLSVESLDVTDIYGTYKVEVMAEIRNTKKRLSELEKRVTTFSKFERDIQDFTDKFNALGTPCRVSHFIELHTECDILLKEVNNSVSNLDDRVVLAKRLEVIKNSICDKKTRNDKIIAAIALLPVPIFGQITSLALIKSLPEPSFVEHNNEQELIETEKRNL